MKTKIKKEYEILLIISIFFSTIIPFALNKLIIYIYNNTNDLLIEFGMDHKSIKALKEILEWILNYLPIIAIASVILIGIRYSLKWFIIGIIPYLFSFHIETIHHFIDNNDLMNNKKLMIYTFIITLIMPFLWYAIIRLISMIVLSERILFILTSLIIVIIRFAYLIVLSIISINQSINIYMNPNNPYFLRIISYQAKQGIISLFILILIYFIFNFIKVRK